MSLAALPDPQPKRGQARRFDPRSSAGRSGIGAEGLSAFMPDQHSRTAVVPRA
jgi:hypothetical protein